METSGREDRSKRQDVSIHLPSHAMEFQPYPKGKSDGVALSTVYFRKCPLSALQTVNCMVIRWVQGDGREGCCPRVRAGYSNPGSGSSHGDGKMPWADPRNTLEEEATALSASLNSLSWGKEDSLILLSPEHVVIFPC